MPAALQAAENSLVPIHTPGGAVLFQQGDPGDSMYLVLHGRLHVLMRDAESGQEELLGEVLAGEAVGEIGLITGEARTATLTAIRDSDLIRLDRETFDRMAAIDPNLWRTLAGIVVGRLRERGTRQRFRPNVSNLAVVAHAASPLVDTFLSRLCEALSSYGSTRRLGANDFRAAVIASPNEDGTEDTTRAAGLAKWLAENEAEQRFVVYEATADDSQWRELCLRQADVSITVARASADAARARPSDDKPSIGVAGSAGRRVLILLHEGRDPEIRGTRAWLEAGAFDEHYHVREGHPEDVERVGRILAGEAVGLVLGGGGARGFAHVGIYRALYEHGIRVDWVGGTSIGSVFAAPMAMGWEPDEVERVAREAFVEGKPMSGLTLPLVSLLSGTRLDRLVAKYFDQEIEDLPVPYFCVATNLSDASLMVQERGNLARAVRASVALPGVFPPVVFGNDLVIDGGVLNNLPADIMATKPVAKVIAVSLSAIKEYKLSYTKIPSAWRILLSKLPFMKPIRVPGLAILMMKATEVASLVHAREAEKDAALFLNPPVRNFGLLDVGAFDALVKVGYEYANERLASWPNQEQDD
ncbi:MAG: NTE family protein [Hyphomicrobiaceae bacterium]